MFDGDLNIDVLFIDDECNIVEIIDIVDHWLRFAYLGTIHTCKERTFRVNYRPLNETETLLYA